MKNGWPGNGKINAVRGSEGNTRSDEDTLEDRLYASYFSPPVWHLIPSHGRVGCWCKVHISYIVLGSRSPFSLSPVPVSTTTPVPLQFFSPRRGHCSPSFLLSPCSSSSRPSGSALFLLSPFLFSHLSFSSLFPSPTASAVNSHKRIIRGSLLTGYRFPDCLLLSQVMG